MKESASALGIMMYPGTERVDCATYIGSDELFGDKSPEAQTLVQFEI